MQTLTKSKEVFGKEIFKCKASTLRLITTKLLFCSPGLIIGTFAVIELIYPGFMNSGRSLDTRFVIAILTAVFIYCFVPILFFKQYEAVVYEQGLVLKYGSKVTELGFDDLKGIQFINQTVKLYGIIRTFASSCVNIFPKNSKKIALNGFRMPDIERFGNEFSFTYTKYAAKDLNRENIYHANISFGSELELKNGMFIFKNKKEVPFDDISSITDSQGVIWLNGLNEKGKNRALITLKVGKTLNFGLLCNIVYNLK